MSDLLSAFWPPVRWDILDESSKVIFGSLLLYLLARALQLPRILLTFCSEDELSAINGIWFGYRVHRSPIDDSLEVFSIQYEFKRRRIKRFESHCEMTTAHMRGGSKPTRVFGSATIEGDNKLLIQLLSSRPRDPRFLWPATAWFFHTGDTRFEKIKVGKSCSVAASGDIVAGDIILSREKMEIDAIISLVQPFDRLSLLDARKVASAVSSTAQKKPSPALPMSGQRGISATGPNSVS